MPALPIPARCRSLLVVLLVHIVVGLGVRDAARAADPDSISSGSLRFFKVAGPDFDRFTADPSPAQQQWMRSHYWRMLTYAPYFDSRVAWFPDAWVYEDLYAIRVGSSLASEHPEWILRDVAGNPLYIPYNCAGGTCPQLAGDVGDPAFRAHWIADAAVVLTHGYRGLYIDDVNMLIARVADGSGAAVAPRDPRTGVEMTEADWRRYVAEFTEEIRAAFPGVELVHNVIWYVGHDDPSVGRQIASADFVNLERGVNDDGLRGGGGTYGLETFLAFVDAIHAAGRHVVFDVSVGGPAREYGLAGYLLVSREGDGFGNAAGSTPDDWWPGYDVDLGDARGLRYEWRGLLRRDFARGYVLVNPPEAPQRTVPVTGIDLTGRSRSTITLPAASGAVFRDRCDPTTGGLCRTRKGQARCLVEGLVNGVAPARVVRCTDGDPACDHDPLAGRCAFSVGWCFNNSDRPGCTAVGMKRLAMRLRARPPTDARTLITAFAGAVAEVAGDAARSLKSRVSFTPPLTATDRCTTPVGVTVALRSRRTRTRAGRFEIRTTATGLGRARDADRMILVCDPAGSG